MLTIILAVGLIVTGLVLLYLASEIDLVKIVPTIGFISFFMGCIMLVVILFTLPCVKPNNRKILYEYQFTKDLVENYYGNDHRTDTKLLDKVLEINEKIAIHRAEYDNPWRNIWRSKEIAFLEPLKLSR